MGPLQKLAGLSPAEEALVEGYDNSSVSPLTRREALVEGLAAALFLAAALSTALLVPAQTGLSVPLAAGFVLAYAAATRIRFPIGFGYSVPTEIVLVPMLFLLPLGLVPLLVAAARGLGNLPDYFERSAHPSRLLLVLGDSLHALGPVLVLAAAGTFTPELSEWPVLLLALVMQFAFDFAGSTAREWFGLGISPRVQPALFGWVIAVDALLAPIGLLAAIAAQDAPATALLVLPLAGLLSVFAGERQARMRQAIELSRAYRGTTLLLSDVLDADDEYTGMHSRGVVSLSVAVADAMGLDSRQRRNVEFGALLHDVGKIAVPKEIINKPGPLTEDEWIVVKTHTIEGQRMLDQVGGLLSEVGRIVRSSHEKWDGSGYPDGLAGPAIPLEATIVSCCDAFSAMTTDRPYRAAMTLAAATSELRAGAGSQFNPAVVEALLHVVEPEPLGEGRTAPRPGIHAVGVTAARGRL